MIEAILVLGSLGLAFGIALSVAIKVFEVKPDPRIERIASILPGINCGACGKAGCMGLAESLIKGPVPDAVFCPLGGEEVSKKIASILGVEITAGTKAKSALICNGGIKARNKFLYKGIKDCQAATAFFEGQKACRYACLGFGSCIDACPFGAIEMGEDGLPQIVDKLCTSCLKCVRSCPKKLIITRPMSSKVYVKCNSRDKGAVVARACKAGCIGCGKCVKACPAGAIKLVDNLARIDYDKCTSCMECVEVCPTKVIVAEEK